MAIFKALMSWLTKSSSAPKAVELEHRNFAPSETAAGDALAVLVADMDGPNGVGVSARIADGLSRLSGVRVVQMNQHITTPSAESMIDGLMAVAEQGRDWLFEHDADILIWGAVDETTQGITLRFLPLNPAPEGRVGAFGLGDQLDIPVRYSAELEDLIVACTLAAGGPTRNGPKAATMVLIHEFAARVKLLADSDLSGLGPAQRMAVLGNIANVVAADSRGEGGQDRLRGAVSIYRQAIAAIPADTDSARQALLHSHLAIALQTMAVGNNSAELLEQVVASYQAAIALLQKTTHAQDWALMHMRLGLALYRLAVQSGQAKLMKDAVLALRQALTVYTKESRPGKWAEVMNHMGVTMTALGEDLANDKVLEQAMNVFNEALAIRKREVVAILWAQTTNNMGAAAFALAKRTKNKAMMEQAAMAFEGAAEVYRDAGQNKRVHVIEKNLQLVQRRLSVM